MKHKLFIFDLDGTVADTPESMWYTCNLCLTTYGLEPQPVEKYLYFAGDGARVMVERALKDAGDPNLAKFDQVYDLYKKLFMEGCTYHVKSFEGLTQTLKTIKNDGLKIAVCTNKAHENAIKVIETIYGKNFFDYIKGHCDLYPKKPDPTSALLIAKEANVKVEECVYVGDTNTDMLTGRNAGIYTVGVTWGFRDRAELEASGADIIIDRPKQLLELI